MQLFAGNDLVTSSLSFAVQRLKHCPLGKTSGTLVFFMINIFLSAKVCKAEVWTFVYREHNKNDTIFKLNTIFVFIYLLYVL